ncbi:helix-turn-helix domain-containing protein [Providencia rettgeri]
MNVDKTVSIIIGKKIKKLRCEAGYTTSAFARLTGCKSEQQLYRYERAINKIDIDTLASILKSLDVSISHFFEQIINEITNESDDYNVII